MEGLRVKMNSRFLLTSAALGIALGIVVTGVFLREHLPLPLSLSPAAIRLTERLPANQPEAQGTVPDKNGRTEVYVFLSPHCPISNSCIPELNRLAAEYSPDGIQFLGVIPGAVAASVNADDFQEKFSIRFPVIIDHSHQIIGTLQATHTPQVIVRENSETVYSGRIDDRFVDLGKSRREATRHDLAEVLAQLSQGVSVTPHTTTPTGCLIERLGIGHASKHTARSSDSEVLTFNRDVAPIIFQHCSRCHREGEVAPFPLLTIEHVRAHASQIDLVTQRRLMPPWKAEPGFASFANEHRLSDDELKRLSQWIASEQIEGDPDDLPLTPIFPSGWYLGKPDLELIMPEPFPVPAEGPDIYQHFVIPTGLTENRLVNAVEFRPGAPEVVHHSITYFDITGRGRELDAEDPLPGYSRLGSPGFAVSGSLGGWGPGGLPRRLPNGMGRPLEKNSDLIVQIHYHPVGRPVQDQSRIGLYFAPPSSTHLVTEIMVANVDLNIPAGESRHHHHAEYILPVETILFDATPHMHVLGKEIKAIAHRPDGSTEPLIWIRDWDFYWQENYVYSEPIRLPKGTRIELDCWFDNSDRNSLNPNRPPQTVSWGDFSTDEMGICYFQATTDTWENYVTLNQHATQYFADLWDKYQRSSAKGAAP